MSKKSSTPAEIAIVNPDKLARLLNQRYGITCDSDQIKTILDESIKPEPKPEAPKFVAVNKIVKIVREQLGLTKKDSVEMHKHLEQDYGADELDIIELMMASEDKFNVELNDDHIETVGDLVASIRVQQYLQLHPDKKLSDSQLELMNSLVSASIQCPLLTWMEYSAKRQVMQKLEDKGLVRMKNVRGDNYEVIVADADLIRP